MRTVLVTRPPGQADEMAALLADRHVGAICVPTVEIRYEVDALIAALRRLDGAAWLVLTSANGAEALGRALDESAARLPSGIRVAAVGPATAARLGAAGIRVDHVPTRYLTVAIAEGLGDVRGQRVVLARAAAASPRLSEVLRERGAAVDEVIAYRTLEAPSASRERISLAVSRPLDGVTFSSGSTVRGLLGLLPPPERPRVTALPAFCIGPVTAEVAQRSGFATPVVAEIHTAAALADAIHDHFERKSP